MHSQHARGEGDMGMTTQNDQRQKALEAAMSQIEKQYGKGAIMKMGDAPRQIMPSISTGSLGLDIALGIRGNP